MTEKGQSSRERIIEAANHLIYTQGYNRTSFADVAAAVGITKGNLHYHFRSKEELLDAVIAYRMNVITAHIEDWEREFSDPRDRLKRYARVLLNEQSDVVRYGCPMGSLNAELAKGQLPLRDRTREMFDAYLVWLTKAFRELGRRDAKSLARHLLALTQGAALMSSVYADERIVKEEHKAIEAWIDSL